MQDLRSGPRPQIQKFLTVLSHGYGRAAQVQKTTKLKNDHCKLIVVKVLKNAVCNLLNLIYTRRTFFFFLNCFGSGTLLLLYTLFSFSPPFLLKSRILIAVL